MDDNSPPVEPSLDRWSVPIDEPDPPATPPPPPADDDADVLHFPLSTEPPSEDYHPRLFRFGGAA